MVSSDVRYFDAREIGRGFEHTNVYVWISSSELRRHTDVDEYDGDVCSDFSLADVRTAYVVFRGTENLGDMLANLDVRTACISVDDAEACAKVHNGFLRQFQAVERPILEYLRSKRNTYDRVVFTGHSLGGALATIAAVSYVCSNTGVEEKEALPQVVCHSFGSPRAGNIEFSEFFERVFRSRDTETETETETERQHWRVFDYEDPVCMVPMSNRFHHVGSRGVCLGHGLDYKAEVDAERESGKRPWYCRPFVSLLRIDPVRPFQPHDMSRYVDKLKRLDRWTEKIRTTKTHNTTGCRPKEVNPRPFVRRSYR